MNEITVNGKVYIKKDSNTPTQIVVSEGRWNIVGNVVSSGDGLTILNASVIRYWGTTKGLGELAKSGPDDEVIKRLFIPRA